jgi:hypothetical protein
MFMSPQAVTPVSGRAWGLRFSYNCSIVDDASSLTLITQNVTGIYGDENEDKAFITRYLSTLPPSEWSGTSNPLFSSMWAYVETALKWKDFYYYERPICNVSEARQGLVTEYVVWQVRHKASPDEINKFNATVGPFVRGLPSPFARRSNGRWAANATFLNQDQRYTLTAQTTDDLELPLKIKDSLRRYSPIVVAEPIGVRCIAASSHGSAMLHPRLATFSDFSEQAPDSADPCNLARGIGDFARSILADKYLDIFTSISSRPIPIQGDPNAYERFLTSQELQKSAMLAYNLEAMAAHVRRHIQFRG